MINGLNGDYTAYYRIENIVETVKYRCSLMAIIYLYFINFVRIYNYFFAVCAIMFLIVLR